jgi:hypothetical protein
VDLRNSGFKLAPVDTNLYRGRLQQPQSSFVPLCVRGVAAVKLPDSTHAFAEHRNLKLPAGRRGAPEGFSRHRRQCASAVIRGTMVVETSAGESSRSEHPAGAAVVDDFDPNAI